MDRKVTVHIGSPSTTAFNCGDCPHKVHIGAYLYECLLFGCTLEDTGKTGGTHVGRACVCRNVERMAAQ